VRNNSGIHDVEGMKGKRIAFVDRVTVTGYLYALSYLREFGVANPEAYFGRFPLPAAMARPSIPFSTAG